MMFISVCDTAALVISDAKPEKASGCVLQNTGYISTSPVSASVGTQPSNTLPHSPRTSKNLMVLLSDYMLAKYNINYISTRQNAMQELENMNNTTMKIRTSLENPST
jgi:hypothetical protein